MKHINKYLVILLGIFALTVVSSCNKEEISIDSVNLENSTEIQSRSLGNYSVVDGRVKFPTIDDFINTTVFLADATENELISFRNSISIETPVKALSAFENALDTSMTDAQIEALLDLYASKLRISTNEDDEIDIDLKYEINPEFTNMNGEYQVGHTIIKQAGTKLISVTDPSQVNLANINENTATDTTLGVYVTETVVALTLGCCPSSKETTEWYLNDGKRYGVRADYYTKNETQVFDWPLDMRYRFWFPTITVNAYGRHHRRLCWGWIFRICRWQEADVNLKHDFYYNAYHNWSAPGIPSPILINRSATQHTSEIRFAHAYRHSTGIVLPKGWGIEPLQLCVTKVNQQVTNLDNGKKASNVCN